MIRTVAEVELVLKGQPVLKQPVSAKQLNLVMALVAHKYKLQSNHKMQVFEVGLLQERQKMKELQKQANEYEETIRRLQENVN